MRNLAEDQRWWYQLDGYQRGKLFFTDVNTGFAVGHYEYAKSGDNTSSADTSVILKTTDACETWSLNKKIGPDSYYLTCIGFADLNNGFAAGTFGAFFKTSDGDLPGRNSQIWGEQTCSPFFFLLQRPVKQDLLRDRKDIFTGQPIPELIGSGMDREATIG